MSNSIPKPPPPSRPRRNSFARAAQAAEAAWGPEATAPAPTPEPAAGAPHEQSDPPQPAPNSGSGKRLGGNSKDILFSLPEEEKDRMINTIAWTTPRTGIRHQSKFIRYAIAKACEDLERAYNDGDQFPPLADSSM